MGWQVPETYYTLASMSSVKVSSKTSASEITMSDHVIGNPQPPQHFQREHIKNAIRFSRLFGTLPYSEIESLDGSKRLIWKWNSWASLYTLLLDSFLIGAVLYGSYRYIRFNLQFIEDNVNTYTLVGKNSTTTSVEKLSMTILPLIHPILFISFLCSGVSSTSSILKLIEGWDSFETYFCKVFSIKKNLFARTMRDANIRGIWAGIIIPAALLPVNFMLRESYCHFPVEESDDGLRTYISPTSQIICTCGTMIPVVNIVFSFCEDFKSIVFIRFIASSFLQLKLAIGEQEGWAKEKYRPRIDQVRSWQTILSLIRKQAKMTESATATQNFITVSVFFVLFCFSLFLGIMMIVNEEMTTASRRTTYNAILLSIIGFGRISVKAKHAEDIGTQEKNLANFLRKIDLDKDELMTQLEMSIIVGTLDRKPTLIRIHGLLELNYSFLATILTTVVTYLVVLLQFNNMESK